MSVHVETIAATRTVAGIERFAVTAGPAPAFRFAVRPGAGTVRAGLCAGALLLAGLLAVEVLPWSASARSAAPLPAALPPASSPLAPPAPPPPRWIEVNRPIQLFDLTGSDFARLPLLYRARRLSDGSARRDLLRYGAFTSDAPALALSILRIGREPDDPFAAAVAAVAADQALAVVRADLPSAVATRFGPFEAADLIVKRGGATRPCLGFRLRPSADGAPVPVAVAGVACGSAAKPVDREDLACVLDRIDLVSAGEDTDLRAFFVEAERRRGQGCTGSRLLAVEGRPTWLDGEALLPRLRPSGAAPARSATKPTNAAEL